MRTYVIYFPKFGNYFVINAESFNDLIIELKDAFPNQITTEAINVEDITSDKNGVMFEWRDWNPPCIKTFVIRFNEKCYIANSISDTIEINENDIEYCTDVTNKCGLILACIAP